MKADRYNYFKWKSLGEIQSGFVTEVMRLPGGFLVRCFGLKGARDDHPAIAMSFVKTHELSANKGVLHQRLVEICD